MNDNHLIEEAITHIEEVVLTCNDECKIEHLQLKDWLLELIELRKKQEY